MEEHVSRAAQARGRFGEAEAARWYVRHGYDVIARNWRWAYGEIDLVLAAPGVIVFCEVKARAGAGYGGPVGAVDRHKQLRVRRAAAAWLAEHRPGAVTVRFDVAAVTGTRVEVFEAAF